MLSIFEDYYYHNMPKVLKIFRSFSSNFSNNEIRSNELHVFNSIT